MKPAIFWTVAREPYTTGVHVIAVTSEKPGRMIYGRDRDGMSTHRRPSDCHGRFESDNAAKAAASQVQAVFDEFQPLIKQADRASTDLRNKRESRIKLVLRQLGAAEA